MLFKDDLSILASVCISHLEKRQGYISYFDNKCHIVHDFSFIKYFSFCCQSLWFDVTRIKIYECDANVYNYPLRVKRKHVFT